MTRTLAPGTIGFAQASGALKDFDPKGRVGNVLFANPELRSLPVKDFAAYMQATYIPAARANGKMANLDDLARIVASIGA